MKGLLDLSIVILVCLFVDAEFVKFKLLTMKQTIAFFFSRVFHFY